MKNVLLISILFSIINAHPLLAQSGVYSNGKLTRLENLMAGSLDGCDSSRRITYSGTIIKINYVGNTDEINGFIIEDASGKRSSLNFTPGVASSLSNADKSWFNQIIKPENKVTVRVILCGNGGIPYIDTVFQGIVSAKTIHSAESAPKIITKPLIPVSIKFRKAITGPGFVAIFTLNYQYDIPTIVTIKSKSLGTTQHYRLDLSAGGTREVGYLEGYAVFPGDQITIENGNFASRSVILSE